MTTDPKDMTDAEREAHIGDCGRLIESEMAAGNREAAMGWMQAMQEAINARTPEQVARLEAERGLLPEPCYFHDKAGLDVPAMLRRQVA